MMISIIITKRTVRDQFSFYKKNNILVIFTLKFFSSFGLWNLHCPDCWFKVFFSPLNLNILSRESDSIA